MAIKKQVGTNYWIHNRQLHAIAVQFWKAWVGHNGNAIETIFFDAIHKPLTGDDLHKVIKRCLYRILISLMIKKWFQMHKT